MTTVEARVVNPVNNPTTVEPVDVADAGMVEAALQREEEKMVVDEEIESCEAEDFDDKMLTVALVKSVVDSGNIKHESKDNIKVEDRLRRKRRHPGDGSPLGYQIVKSAPETSALHKLSPVPDPMRNPLMSGSRQPILGGAGVVALDGTNIKQEDPTEMHSESIRIKEEPPGTAANETQAGAAIATPKQPPPIAPALPSTGATHQHLPIAALPAAAPDIKSETVVVQPAQAVAARPIAPLKAKPALVAPKPDTKRGSTTKTTKKPSSRKGSSKCQKAKKVTLKVPPNATTISKDGLTPTSGAVPNPLSSTPAELPILPKTVAFKQELVPQENQPSVPCPLPAPVPCPLGPGTPTPAHEEHVSNVSIALPLKRGRIFSVDLDRDTNRAFLLVSIALEDLSSHDHFAASTFDFTDMVSDYADADRSDNADMSDPTGSQPSDLAIFQRERAFSFEVFNFSSDDLLPPPPPHAGNSTTSELPAPSVLPAPAMPTPVLAAPAPALPALAPEPEVAPVLARPRGDSIIFDPVSFQEGGIHEKNALLKVQATDLDGPPQGLLADSKLAAPQLEPDQHTPHPNTPNPLPMYTTVEQTPPVAPGSSSEIATLPSALSNNAANASSPATFQMELLNKDGRIGIYLPEARRQRIARFHAKRKMRIWRKRIKYDCRKKLADSRPRIKGRFVKRSDMDDE
eukprot:CAMPEP_0117070622 /NCGR_PEP_ID=MMETSP0472-20121206/49622_1 /TAXON_ID=693140 ORGANISM="Tiarina fusus, Strain LIS" /NCGR_SAMPLE_ID=MMETSP0472 /ASSEMBLY_ACC=CAM_ASM_000603 /LENGTH=686 /DNA_ID=CAMNT_0004793815 /DNA_START=57 /DNA_END=2118 /DNA_ORIENTATION=+